VAFHVDLAALLFIVWGALTVLIGLSTLALGIASTALASSPAVQDRQFAAGFLAATFTTLAALAILWGVLHIAVGLPLRRRRHWSRMAALMLGSVDLLLLPYGTALGCYALWALLHRSGRLLFEAEPPAAL
jgi:hypothetical protein